jgi:hypothetical protein
MKNNSTCSPRATNKLVRVTGGPDIRPLSYIILVNLFNSEFANMASTTNNIDADEYSEDQQHVEPGQGSSNSKKAKTWRMQNFSDSWPGQKQNCKIVYFFVGLLHYLLFC